MDSGDAHVLYTTSIAPAPFQVPRLRARLEASLRGVGLPPGTIADVALVATELLSNAVTAAHDEVALTVWGLPGAVEVIVTDDGRGLETLVGDPDPLAPGGRGLALVRALTASLELERIGGLTRARALVRAPAP